MDIVLTLRTAKECVCRIAANRRRLLIIGFLIAVVSTGAVCAYVYNLMFVNSNVGVEVTS